ncbi:hypothetical protein C8J57DRAFT_1234308 [Mycena rebaudengoi]|nr:hypothetical protein C8J57DRAFT_1234308 [Mycena rebaudengoi]
MGYKELEWVDTFDLSDECAMLLVEYYKSSAAGDSDGESNAPKSDVADSPAKKKTMQKGGAHCAAAHEGPPKPLISWLNHARGILCERVTTHGIWERMVVEADWSTPQQAAVAHFCQLAKSTADMPSLVALDCITTLQERFRVGVATGMATAKQHAPCNDHGVKWACQAVDEEDNEPVRNDGNNTGDEEESRDITCVSKCLQLTHTVPIIKIPHPATHPVKPVQPRSLL